MERRTVGIVGTGNVGVAAAYSIFQQQIASELILIDYNYKRAEGEAMDLMHGQSFVGRVTVRAGSYEDLSAAQVVVITAGVPQKPGESRLALLNRNAEIFQQIAQALDQHAPNAMLVVASNPVDVLTYVMQELSKRSPNQIVGTGTMLDTARLRALLGEYYGVDPRSVHAYILGEHGDSEVPIWSQATIAGQRLIESKVLGKAFDGAAMNGIYQKVMRAAYDIIDRKGYTNLCIGLVIASLVEAILDDQKSLLPVSVRLSGQYAIDGVCLAVPAVVGINGVEALVPPEVAENELEKLQESAKILKSNLESIEIKRS